MYQNPYMNYQQGFNQQSMNERIDNQIAQLQQMKEQMKNNQQQPAINQTFQLAPTHSGGMRYANSLEDVNREMVYVDTPFFSKDMSVVWIKNNKNEIKTYELKEIVPLDEKDMQIQYLQSQIEELKGMIKNESNVSNVDTKQNATDTTTDDGATGTTAKKSKSTNVSKVSGSKEE
jgi:hypothetical protein